MAVKSRAQLKKEVRKKQLQVSDARKAYKKEIAALDPIAKMKYDIEVVRTQVRNCEYDLQGMFKGHHVIEHKRDILKNQLKQKEEELSRCLAVVPLTS